MLYSEGVVKVKVTQGVRNADRDERSGWCNSESRRSHQMFDPGRGEGYALGRVRRMSWPSWR
jgi:hypothetical protein